MRKATKAEIQKIIEAEDDAGVNNLLQELFREDAVNPVVYIKEDGSYEVKSVDKKLEVGGKKNVELG